MLTSLLAVLETVQSLLAAYMGLILRSYIRNNAAASVMTLLTNQERP